MTTQETPRHYPHDRLCRDYRPDLVVYLNIEAKVELGSCQARNNREAAAPFLIQR